MQHHTIVLGYKRTTVDLSNVQDSGQNANNPSATSSNLQYSCISWTVDESKFKLQEMFVMAEV